MKNIFILGFLIFNIVNAYSDEFSGFWTSHFNQLKSSGDRTYLVVNPVADKYLIVYFRLSEDNGSPLREFIGFTGIGTRGEDFTGQDGIVIDVDNDEMDYFIWIGSNGAEKDKLILDYAATRTNDQYNPNDYMNVFDFNQPSFGELNAFAVVNDNNVNYRDSSSLRSQKLGQLMNGDLIRLTSRTEEQEQIGNEVDYWYRFYKVNDVFTGGWVFGSFLDIKFEKINRDEDPGYTYKK